MEVMSNDSIVEFGVSQLVTELTMTDSLSALIDFHRDSFADISDLNLSLIGRSSL